MGRQNQNRRQKQFPGLGGGTCGIEKYAPEKTLFLQKLQEKELGYNLRCLLGIKVFSSLPESRK